MTNLKTTSLGVLADIARATQVRIAKAKTQLPPAELTAKFGKRVLQPDRVRSVFLGCQGSAIIAEIKRASPSRGDIDLLIDPCQVAREYLSNGATALSVLTEPDFFKGSLQYIEKIRQNHPEAILLMKDFFIDEYQLLQAKAAGADMVLIIMSLLDVGFAKHMKEVAESLGLVALVEVHDETELKEALSIAGQWIGINNRNLKTMATDIQTSLDLIPFLPDNVVAISESGIHSQADMKTLANAGFHGYLVGTGLMETGEPGAALSRLKGVLL